jgi:predicted small lipoprotein YifL
MNAIKLIGCALAATLTLAACGTTGYQPPRERSAADLQWEYGLHAGEPMRDSPKQ